MLLACLIAAPLLAAGEPEGGAAAIGVSERVAFSQIQTLAAEATGTAAEVQRLLPPVTVVRKLLSLKDPPIDETIGSGVVPSLVRLLAPSFGFHLRTEAAWALTNIASGTAEHARYLIAQGAVAPLVAALAEEHAVPPPSPATPKQASDARVGAEADGQGGWIGAVQSPSTAAEADPPATQMRHQAAWALGNLLADDSAHRDLVLQRGGLVARYAARASCGWLGPAPAHPEARLGSGEARSRASGARIRPALTRATVCLHLR